MGYRRGGQNVNETQQPSALISFIFVESFVVILLILGLFAALSPYVIVSIFGIGLLSAAGAIGIPMTIGGIFDLIRYFSKKIKKNGGYIGGYDEQKKYDMYTFMKVIEKVYEGSKYKEKRTLFDRVFSNLLKLVVKLSVRTRMLNKEENHILENKTNELSKSFLNKFEKKLDEIKSNDSINNTMKKLKRMSLIMRSGREADPSKFEKITLNVFKQADKNAQHIDIKEKYEDIAKDIENTKLSKREKLNLIRRIRRDIKKMSKYLKSKPHDLDKILK